MHSSSTTTNININAVHTRVEKRDWNTYIYIFNEPVQKLDPLHFSQRQTNVIDSRSELEREREREREERKWCGAIRHSSQVVGGLRVRVDRACHSHMAQLVQRLQLCVIIVFIIP